jgi:hypothetical protein
MSRLVVRGAPASSNIPAFVFGLVLVAAAGAGFAAEQDLFPWLSNLEVGRFSGVICVGTTVAGLMLVAFLSRRSSATLGRVELEDSTLDFFRDRMHVRLNAADLAGYRDGDDDFIELELRGDASVPRSFRPLTIPTPTEKDRVAVLEALDRCGLRRLVVER